MPFAARGGGPLDDGPYCCDEEGGGPPLIGGGLKLFPGAPDMKFGGGKGGPKWNPSLDIVSHSSKGIGHVPLGGPIMPF